MVRLLTLSGLILLLAAPTASAGVREKILRECQNGRITGNYTPGQLRDARRHIPTDLDEYSDCRDVLARAALGGGNSGGGGGDRSVAPGGVTPNDGPDAVLEPYGSEERQALDKVREGQGVTSLSSDRMVPGATGLVSDTARRGLPTTLLVLLILLGLCALAAGLPTVRRRVIARRQR